MRFIPNRRHTELFAAVLIGAALASATWAQEKPADRSQFEDVVRTNTELVQTDVMVFDKQGTFIRGLKKEQFELRVDKKPRTILFFEPITAGSASEEAQLVAARGGPLSSGSDRKGTAVPLDRGRTVFFYVDDFHLSPGSGAQTRKLLLRFIDREMGQNDEAAITSPSGQIGFLQQLTDNKTVLRQAAELVRSRPYTVRDFERPEMSEYQALLIDHNDFEVLGVFVDALLRDNPGISRAMAEELVRGRARQLLEQADRIATNSLLSLESLIKSSANLPGRKLVFLISDGFLLNDRLESADRFRRVTSAAARAGVVIYSLDARGLVVGLSAPSSDVPFDPSGRLQRSSMGEISASQNVLHALASDTGGRALFNTNDLSAGITRGLKETSVYYLLAWRPESEDLRGGRSNRVEVSIVGRPNLVVRLRRPADKERSTLTGKQKTGLPPPTKKESDAPLRDAMTSLYPVQGFPTSLVAQFLNTAAGGSIISVASELGTEGLTFVLNNGVQTANVDIVANVYDAEGKLVANSQHRVTVKATSTDPKAPPPDSFSYNGQFKLKPGLYQVRVAARDEKSGRTGSARQWIEIPDLTSRKLALSSLLLAERNASPTELASQTAELEPATLSIDHRFPRASRLRFVIFVYNATRPNPSAKPSNANSDSGAAPTAIPDVAIQVQVFRDDQPIITTTLRKLEVHTESDLGRLPYAAELSLADLQRGRYRLLVTAIDRVGKVSATEQAVFVID
ncbi:MAG: VWA domain-containing protein [Pyrinomonadaceae bacterium]